MIKIRASQARCDGGSASRKLFLVNYPGRNLVHPLGKEFKRSVSRSRRRYVECQVRCATKKTTELLKEK